MAKIGTFLNNLAVKYGIDVANEPGYTDLLSANLEVPDNIAQKFEGVELFNETSAMHNVKLKNHFAATALATVDKKVGELLAFHDIPPELRTAIDAETSSYKKVELLTAAIKEATAAKSGATGAEKQNLQQAINALNAEKADLLSKKDQELSQQKATYEDRLRNMLINSKIANAQLDTTRYDKDTAVQVARAVLDRHLQTKGINIVNDGDILKPKQAQDSSLDYYENNTAMTFDAIVDKVLADNKLLAVSAPAPAQANTFGPARQQQTTTNVPGSRPPVSAPSLNKFDSILNDWQKGSKVV